MSRGYTDDELRDALRAFAKEHDGQPPTAIEMNDSAGYPGADTFVRHFGTWNDALTEAGLDTRTRGQSEADHHDGLNGASLADYCVCSDCGESYLRADALKRHVAAAHEGDGDEMVVGEDGDTAAVGGSCAGATAPEDDPATDEGES